MQATESEVKGLKEAYEQQQQESIDCHSQIIYRYSLFFFKESFRKKVAVFFPKRFGAGASLIKTIDQLEIKIKTMSDQLRQTENALKEEKKKREHESMTKDTQLKELRKHYEQQLKGTAL